MKIDPDASKKTMGYKKITPDEVGQFNFCPMCGRPVTRKSLFYDLDNQSLDEIALEDIECSCCQRPWIACPCTPWNEGECRSIINDESWGKGKE